MTLSETLHHILHLTLFWWREEKSQYKASDSLLESPESISTPLGVVAPYRRVNVNAHLPDGIEKAKNRNYAIRKCKRLKNNERQEKHIPTQ